MANIPTSNPSTIHELVADAEQVVVFLDTRIEQIQLEKLNVLYNDGATLVATKAEVETYIG